MSALRADARPHRGVPSRRGAGRRRSRTALRVVGRLIVALVVVAAVGGAVFKFVVPSAADAETRAADLASTRGVSVSAAPPPPRVADALIATEDARFRTNSGIDPAGVLRWAVGAVAGGSADAGGATIEQQLAKMLYTDGHRAPIDQLEQVGLALKLNADFAKADILRMYLDTAYFGHGYYGASAASLGYFGRPPADLDWQQAALLAGLVQAPTAYDPTVHPALALSRRAHVLARLAATGYLTTPQAAALAATPLGLR